MEAVVIMGISTLLQFAATILAWRLIPITGERKAWVLIASAILLMAVHRCIILFGLLSGAALPPSEPSADDWVTLVTSVLMLAGLAGIAPLFECIRRSAQVVEVERKRLFSLFEELPALVYLQAQDYSIRFANRFFRERFGDPSGKACYEILRGRNEPCKECRPLRVLETKEPQQWEWNGLERGTYELFDYPFTDVDGSPLVLELGMDITERKQIETALRESEESYRGIFENAPIGIFQSHPSGRFLSVNPALTQMLGYESPDELLSTITDIGKQLHVHPEQRARFIVAAQKHDVNARCEVQLRRKDGQIITTYISGSAIRNGDGTIRYLVGIVEDITEHKRAEEELRGSERRYRRLVESSPEAIFVLRKGRIVLANNAAGRLFRAANPISLLGRSAMDLVDENYREIVAAQLEIVTEEKCRLPFAEEELIRLDGTVIPVEISAIPFCYEGCWAVQWVAHDISEHKRAEEAIRRQNEYLTALHETSLGLVSRLEPDELLKAILIRATALVKAPTGFLYLYNASKGELEMKVGLHFHEKRIGNRVKPGEGIVGKVWQMGCPFFVDNYAQWAGRIPDPALDVITTAAGIPLKLGSQFLGVIGLSYTDKHPRFGKSELSLLTRFAELASIALDNARLYSDLQSELSERRRMEGELLSAKEAAEAANRSKSDFLACMSHELRTPLNAIIGFSELTVDQKFGLINDTQAEYLGYVLQSSRHLLSLINDMLDLAKVEAGKMVLELGQVSVEEVLQASLMMIREKAFGQDIVLSTDIEQVSEMTLMADERKLRQILYNLLSNAVKFTPNGGEIRLSAKMIHYLLGSGPRHGDPGGFCFMVDATDRTLPDKSMESMEAGPPTGATLQTTAMGRYGKGIEVCVADTGIGIKSEDLERIFKPFEQSDSPLTRRFAGTGLGLSLTRRLVELHGGKVWAESPGLEKGSVFRFVIPVC